MSDGHGHGGDHGGGGVKATGHQGSALAGIGGTGLKYIIGAIVFVVGCSFALNHASPVKVAISVIVLLAVMWLSYKGMFVGFGWWKADHPDPPEESLFERLFNFALGLISLPFFLGSLALMLFIVLELAGLGPELENASERINEAIPLDGIFSE